ncbi:MAG: hypothetical protein JO304_15955 [Solirubrobacterales bacterium]|nr:hypothetical protein [Solirubrobacterales bacterium]
MALGSMDWGTYDRSSANTAVTEVRAVVGIDPRLRSTPNTNTTVSRLYVAWSNGRLGLPQPFEASMPMP